LSGVVRKEAFGSFETFVLGTFGFGSLDTFATVTKR
jgi:hypothetical protein